VSRFVLDTTVTVAWCFCDEATELTENLLSRLSNLTDSALVPTLWLYEVVNGVELATRKGRITEDKARAFLASLVDLPIEIENPLRTPKPVTPTSGPTPGTSAIADRRTATPQLMGAGLKTRRYVLPRR
jgi:hypothetical protein